MERAVNAFENYFQQFYQKVQSSRDSEKSRTQSASLEAVLTCFEALLEFDVKRCYSLQESLKSPPPRLLPRVLKLLRAYITALLPSALFALNTRIIHDTWIDTQTACASDRLLPLLRRIELHSRSTPAAETLPPALSALVERALVEWLPLGERISHCQRRSAHWARRFLHRCSRSSSAPSRTPTTAGGGHRRFCTATRQRSAARSAFCWLGVSSLLEIRSELFSMISARAALASRVPHASVYWRASRVLWCAHCSMRARSIGSSRASSSRFVALLKQASLIRLFYFVNLLKTLKKHTWCKSICFHVSELYYY